MPPKKIVLVGGGHSHALALLLIKNRLQKKARCFLVGDNRFAPYSGMLPGFIAGHYSRRQCFIDLRALAKKSGATLIDGRATAVAAGDNTVTLADGEKLSFDILSVNIGGAQNIAVADSRMQSVKPIGDFMAWMKFLESCDNVFNIVVVGGGAGGVELSLAVDFRLRKRARKRPAVTLLSPRLLPHYPPRVARYFQKKLAAQDINIVVGKAIPKMENGKLLLEDGGGIVADKVIFSTPVAAAKWPRESDLQTDARGFICIADTLQSVSHSNIFACGDCASFAPKSGVVAVRQAPVLAHNLAATVDGAPLKKFCLPKRLLSIISEGDKNATAIYGGMAARGGWVWRWKNRLDLSFMNAFV